MTHSSESVPLEELCDYIIEGIVTPKGKEKYISDHKKDSRYQKFLEGKDIGPYKVRPKKKYILYDRNILHRARPQEVHEACPKILIQRISGGFYPLKAAVDMGRHYTFASINNLILKEEYREWYYYLCGILNSSLMNAYYGGNFSNFSHLTVNIAGSFLEQLPIVLDKKRKLGLERIVQSISGKEDIDRKSNEISKIDSLVFEIYGVKGQMRRQILALLDNEEVDAPVIAA
jgi:hypothetical protein